jgi:hypothetical protein
MGMAAAYTRMLLRVCMLLNGVGRPHVAVCVAARHRVCGVHAAYAHWPPRMHAGVGLFGTKAGMMSYFTEDGLCVPATVLALEEGNIVTMVKTDETDGYNAVQVI